MGQRGTSPPPATHTHTGLELLLPPPRRHTRMRRMRQTDGASLASNHKTTTNTTYPPAPPRPLMKHALPASPCWPASTRVPTRRHARGGREGGAGWR